MDKAQKFLSLAACKGKFLFVNTVYFHWALYRCLEFFPFKKLKSFVQVYIDSRIVSLKVEDTLFQVNDCFILQTRCIADFDSSKREPCTDAM